ncbi:SIR2 family NAD-dependent protein deacylase [Variovorax sp. LT1P1]|uniref:SIR2 family NAD-dependent protein deacylase n=1 Tax=Variovorax sp. LT1P1 TaxID=3443730 RepID=UPI003F44892C
MNTTLQPHQTQPPQTLIEDMRSARRVVVLTGAGMSAESGIPTFRDSTDGMWAQFDVRSLATAAGFQRDPALVWSWYESRRKNVADALPNPGHLALACLAELPWIEELTVVTQNVDDLHERAGSTPVHHLHGSLFAPRCFSCHRPHVRTDSDSTGTEVEGPLGLPLCRTCGGFIRPGVVWFGESLPEDVWMASMAGIARADLMLVVGTSGQVHPAALLPETARRHGCAVWVLNPDESAASHLDDFWPVTAAHGLPSVLAQLRLDERTVNQGGE